MNGIILGPVCICLPDAKQDNVTFIGLDLFLGNPIITMLCLLNVENLHYSTKSSMVLMNWPIFYAERYDLQLFAHLGKCWFTLVHIFNVIFTVI